MLLEHEINQLKEIGVLQIWSRTPSRLPNIILLGDFNMPEVIWDNPHAYNPSSELLIDLATLLFLNQQVSTPKRKSNVLD